MISSVRRCAAQLAPLVGVLLFGGCATVPHSAAGRAEYRAENDPLEPLNRKVFAFNQFVDRHAIKPLAQDYVRYVPHRVRDALHHLLDNLNEPMVVANNLLQGRFRGAAIAGMRFVINTTSGPAGLRDMATREGLPPQSGDFGQTLYTWGVGSGPYLVLPLFGPSSPRDAIGQGIDAYFDPVRAIIRKQESADLLTTSREVVSGIGERARNLQSLDALQATSIDFYAALRSYYRQNRATELRHGKAPPVPANLYEDPDLEIPPAPAAGGAESGAGLPPRSNRDR